MGGNDEFGCCDASTPCAIGRNGSVCVHVCSCVVAYASICTVRCLEVDGIMVGRISWLECSIFHEVEVSGLYNMLNCVCADFESLCKKSCRFGCECEDMRRVKIKIKKQLDENAGNVLLEPFLG